MAVLPRKVPLQREHTGIVANDRAQRMAQQTSVALDQTKSIVAALMNRQYAELTTSTTIAAAAYATLLTVTILTTLKTGNLLINFTASGLKLTALGTAYFRLVVDGVTMNGTYTTVPTANYAFAVAMTSLVPVSAGKHVVQVQWKTDFNSLRISPTTVTEEHAHLLVQETN